MEILRHRRFWLMQRAIEGPMLRTLTVVLFRLLLAVAPSGLILLSSASAQIRTDGSVGPARSLLGPGFSIGPGLGKQVGPIFFIALRRSMSDAGKVRHSPAPPPLATS